MRATDAVLKVTGKARSTTNEFRQFLDEYKIIGIAVGFVLGAATTAFVKSLVDNMVMPFLAPWEGGWQNATATLGPVTLGWGQFVSALINFIIIALVVFFIVKKLMKK